MPHTVKVHLHSVQKVLWKYRLLLVGQYEWIMKECWGSLTMTAPATFYTWGTKIAYQWQNCGFASALRACRRKSSKEGFAELGHAGRRPECGLIKDLLLSTQSRQTWHPSPDRESSATQDGERAKWKSLVSSHRTAELGQGQRNWGYLLNTPRVNADTSTSK